MSLTNPCCAIGTNLDTKAVHVTSMDECLRHNGDNKKSIILVGTILEVEIGPKANALVRQRNFFVAKFDFGGGDMKLATINIMSVKLHTTGPLFPSNNGDGGDRSTGATTTNTGDITITDTVFFQVFEVPATDPVNDEAFIVVVVQPMAETPGRPLYPLTEDGGLVVEAVLDHLMDASTVEMPTPPTIPLCIPVRLPPTSLPLIPTPRTTSPQRSSPKKISTTRSHSTGDKAGFHWRKWFEDHYGVRKKINGPYPLRQWFLRTTIW